MRKTEAHEAVMIVRRATDRLLSIGLGVEVDDDGQVVIYPPDGWDFTLEAPDGLTLRPAGGEEHGDEPRPWPGSIEARSYTNNPDNT